MTTPTRLYIDIYDIGDVSVYNEHEEMYCENCPLENISVPQIKFKKIHITIYDAYETETDDLVLPPLECDYLVVESEYQSALKCAELLNLPLNRVCWIIEGDEQPEALSEFDKIKILDNFDELDVLPLPNMSIEITDIDQIDSSIPKYCFHPYIDLPIGSIDYVTRIKLGKTQRDSDSDADPHDDTEIEDIDTTDILKVFPNVTHLQIVIPDNDEPHDIIIESDKITNLTLSVKQIGEFSIKGLPNLAYFKSHFPLPDDIQLENENLMDIIVPNRRIMKSSRKV